MAKVKDVSEFAESVREEAEAIQRGAGPIKRAIATLGVLVAHGPCTHDVIARQTGKTKGNRLRPLRLLGYVDADDSQPAPVYSLTPEGRAFLQRHA